MDLWSNTSEVTSPLGSDISSPTMTAMSTPVRIPSRARTSRTAPVEVKRSHRGSISKYFKFSAVDDISDDESHDDGGGGDDDHYDNDSEEDNDDDSCHNQEGVGHVEENAPFSSPLMIESPRKKYRQTNNIADETSPSTPDEATTTNQLTPFRFLNNSGNAPNTTTLRSTDDLDWTRDRLLLVLLQHTARQINPDPRYFAQAAKQLLDRGLLTDKKFADFNYLKTQTKEFSREFSAYLSPSETVPEIPLRRSGSVDSLLSTNHTIRNIGSDDVFDHKNDNPTLNQFASLLQMTASQYSFVEYLFSSHSRFNLDFINRKRIGRGAFGSVYRAQHRVDTVVYAIKQIKFTFKNTSDLNVTYERVLREVKSLAQLNHPNIVRYNQAWFEPGHQKDESEHERSNTNFEEEFSELDEMEESNASSVNHGEEDGIFALDHKDSTNDGSSDEDNFETELHFEWDEEIDGASNRSKSALSSTSRNDSEKVGRQLNHLQALQDLCNFSPASFSPKDMSYLEYHIQKNAAERNAQRMLPTSPTPALSHPKTFQRLIENTSPISKHRDEPPRTERHAGKTLQPKDTIDSLLEQMFDQKKNRFAMCLYIQMELCSSATLEDYLWSERRCNLGHVDLGEILLLFWQICRAVEYIHSKDLIHRDIKPSNLFISEDNVIKLGDFGLAKICRELDVEPMPTSPNDSHVSQSKRPPLMAIEREQNSTTSLMITTESTTSSSTHTSGIGTPTYASPEQLQDTEYDEKTDIFSLGLIFFEMLHPFSTRSERAIVLTNLRQGEIPQRMLEQYPDEMQLVKSCINADAEKRPSASDVLRIVTNLTRQHNIPVSLPFVCPEFTPVESTSVSAQPAAIITESTSSSSLDTTTATTATISSSPEILLQQIHDRDDEIIRLRKEIDLLRATNK